MTPLPAVAAGPSLLPPPKSSLERQRIFCHHEDDINFLVVGRRTGDLRCDSE